MITGEELLREIRMAKKEFSKLPELPADLETTLLSIARQESGLNDIDDPIIDLSDLKFDEHAKSKAGQYTDALGRTWYFAFGLYQMSANAYKTALMYIRVYTNDNFYRLLHKDFIEKWKVNPKGYSIVKDSALIFDPYYASILAIAYLLYLDKTGKTSSWNDLVEGYYGKPNPLYVLHVRQFAAQIRNAVKTQLAGKEGGNFFG